MDFSSDIELFYDDFAVTAIHTPAAGGKSRTGKVILDQPGTVLLNGQALATEYSVRYPGATFPDVKRGDTFLVGSVTYIARESAQPGSVDGLEHIVPLKAG